MLYKSPFSRETLFISDDIWRRILPVQFLERNTPRKLYVSNSSQYNTRQCQVKVSERQCDPAGEREIEVCNVHTLYSVTGEIVRLRKKYMYVIIIIY